MKRTRAVAASLWVYAGICEREIVRALQLARLHYLAWMHGQAIKHADTQLRGLQAVERALPTHRRNQLGVRADETDALARVEAEIATLSRTNFSQQEQRQ